MVILKSPALVYHSLIKLNSIFEVCFRRLFEKDRIAPVLKWHFFNLLLYAKNFIFFLTGIFMLSKSYGQLSPSDQHILDSLLQNDELLKMINNYDKNFSYFRVNVGVGNNLYSSQDKSIESLQSSQRFVVSPSVGYYHKSGFGISFAGFLLTDNNKTDFYQYTLTPSYSYKKGKVADLLISYTHYFEKSIYNNYTSPIQNEFYGNILFKKPWLKPGIALGYSTGKFDQSIQIDTTVRILNRLIAYHI